jgi:hypothetical protein
MKSKQRDHFDMIIERTREKFSKKEAMLKAAKNPKLLIIGDDTVKYLLHHVRGFKKLHF